MIKRLFLIVASVVTVIGAWEAIEIPQAQAATCCTYGVDCTGADKCCKPGFGQANCSKLNPNYCQSACTQ
jgi:hypothetical protein